MEYLFILVAVLLISPFVLYLASKQGRKSKDVLRLAFSTILIAQFLLGFLGWESFNLSGKSGFGLAFNFLSSFLIVYFAVILIQILLVIYKSYSLAVALSFVNSVMLFFGLIRASNFVGFQLISLASILSVFAVLFNNVIGLAWINKDKNLLRKYFA